MNYHRRILQLQTYLPECTWAAGTNKGSPMVITLELNLRENLAKAIAPDQMEKLIENNQNIWCKKYVSTILKLEHYQKRSMLHARK